jgi:NAD(P)-dependent dehydrogenase (short-subunit alcohol dehydrogenase family)
MADTPSLSSPPSPSLSPSLSSPLSHRVAVVTGGSRGLGRGVVEALASRGARVLAIARDEAALFALSRDIPGVVPIVGDATDGALAERVLTQESPDLVVVCAGAMPVLGPLHEQSWEGFSTNWNVDVKSAFVWLGHALRLPMKRGGHAIVVSSGAAVQGSPASGGYAPAKRAQWLMADYAANESVRAGLGLRVHCLLPTLNPSTALGRAGIAAYAERAGVTPEEFARRFAPPLTPAVMGQGVVELFEAPERFAQLAYRIGGTGLSPVA